MLFLIKNWKLILFFLVVIICFILGLWISSLKSDIKELDTELSETKKLVETCSESTKILQDELATCNEEFNKLNDYYCKIQSENTKKDKKIKEIESVIDKLKKQECKCEKELTPEINEELIDIYNGGLNEVR